MFDLDRLERAVNEVDDWNGPLPEARVRDARLLASALTEVKCVVFRDGDDVVTFALDTGVGMVEICLEDNSDGYRGNVLFHHREVPS